MTASRGGKLIFIGAAKRSEREANGRIPAARFARVLGDASRPRSKRGRGEAGRPMRPIAACAMGGGRTHTRWSGHTGITRHSPRNGLRLIYNVISPVNGSFATVALRVFSQDLTPAPRCQDHTLSPYASGAFVKGAIRVHRNPSRVDDVGQRPSFGMG